MSTTALAILNAAYGDIGVKAPGETLSGPLGTDGLLRLNKLVGNWALQGLTSLTTDKHVFNVTANVQTYLIGPGGSGTFLTARPQSITNTAILLNNTSPGVENSLGPPLTDDAYAAIAIKTLTNAQFTSVYYNQSYPNGTIFLWPCPTTSLNNLVLYYPTKLTEFATLATPYDLAPGYELALEFSIAVDLATPNGRDLPPLILKRAQDTLSDLKRQNVRLTDLSFDPALTWMGTRRYPYNINTDQP